MWRAIWNGPFHIGKLERPVSVGDAIMKVLETLWRTAIVLICGVLALVAFLFFTSRLETQRNNEALSQVVTTVQLEDQCQAGQFGVTIKNNSRWTLSFIDYRVVMNFEGRDVTPDHLTDLWSSTDILPGYELTICHSTAFTEYGSPTNYRTEVGTTIGATVERVIVE